MLCDFRIFHHICYFDTFCCKRAFLHIGSFHQLRSFPDKHLQQSHNLRRHQGLLPHRCDTRRNFTIWRCSRSELSHTLLDNSPCE
jgi:hypothetical protein